MWPFLGHHEKKIKKQFIKASNEISILKERCKQECLPIFGNNCVCEEIFIQAFAQIMKIMQTEVPENDCVRGFPSSTCPNHDRETSKKDMDSKSSS